MRLWFGGTETATWRTLLADEGVSDMTMSFASLARRVKMPWLVVDKFPAGAHVLLDSGALSLHDVPLDEQVKLADNYLDFIQLNIQDLSYVVEMDAPGFSRSQVRAYRDALATVAGEKMIVVAHGQDGLADWKTLAGDYPRIAVTSTSVNGHDISKELRQLHRDGIELFGAGMLRVEVMNKIPWHSVYGSSWSSPTRFGETVIFINGRLQQFHAREKEDVRRRYRPQIIALGCDPDKVLADDRKETLRLSIRSWNAQLAAVNKVVTTKAQATTLKKADPGRQTVATIPPKKRHETTTGRTREPLPGSRIEHVQDTYRDPDTGMHGLRDLPVLRRDDEPLRSCSTCRLATVPCPKFEAGATCAYEFPLELRSPRQLRAASEMVLEMKLELLLRRKFESELEGGHDLDTLSLELDRTFKMLAQFHAMDQEGFKITVQGHGGAPTQPAGVLSRFFSTPLQHAIAPADPPSTYIRAEVLDAEIIDAD